MSSDFLPGDDRLASHAAAGFEFATGQGREHWWALLSEPVKQRLLEFVGTVVEWWAYTGADGRPYAVVFGERGLTVSAPATNESGGPSQQLSIWTFVPSSVRHVAIAPDPGSDGGSRRTAAAPLQDALTARMRGFLGNLPIDAQQRLQQPFFAGDPVMSSDFFFYGTDAELDTWCYLAGRRTVTFARGHRSVVPDERPAWQLTCWHASVKRD